jgi:hypothetical protein
MTMLAICMMNEKDCRHYFLMSVLVCCFAHRLQLALVAACQKVIVVHKFFSNLNFITNVVSASCKCHSDLQDAPVADFTHLIAMDKLETGKGANEIDTLK